MAFAELEGIGALEDERRAANVVCAIYNVNRAPGTRPLAPHDVCSRLRRPARRRQNWQEMSATLQALTKAAGGTVVPRT